MPHANGYGVQKVTVLGSSGTLDRQTTGSWAYSAGTGGGTVNITGRVVGSFFHAEGGAGTVTIDGGDTITIRTGGTIALNPQGNLVNPTIVMSGTIDYMIEYVTS